MSAKLVKPIQRRKTMFKPDEFDIIRKIGDGNFGDVFKVKMKADGRELAMKTLRGNVCKAMRDAFVKEMDMMANMYHENIVKFVGVVKCEADIKILLELVNQGSLDKLLSKGRLTERGKTRLLLDVARGIAYLHSRGLIHRDLAARNVLVNKSKDGSITAKVSDFGLSRKDDQGRGYQLRTSQKLPLKWLAPECFTKRLWSAASDVWSYGIIIWEVMSEGREPYADMQFANAQALSAFIAGGGHPTLVPMTNKELEKIMRQCWTTDMVKRPKMDVVLLEMENMFSAMKTSAASSSAKSMAKN